MARRGATHREKCAHEGCEERSCYEFDSQREYSDFLKHKHAPWRCVRHTNPEEVLSDSNTTATQVLIASRVPSRAHAGFLDGLFWCAEGKPASSGFLYGPGFKAYASDFPEGAKLTITARIEFPEPRYMETLDEAERRDL